MRNKIELLSPAGDINCVRAAVQNGADAIYIGYSEYSARAGNFNFTLEEIKDIIHYAHVHNVKVYLALNTLIKNNELENAISVVSKTYEYGIDAIIVQDLGLATILINHFPKLPIHASTQMTAHNLSGVKTLENFGFKRVILSREMYLEEIEHVCRNTNVEIEVFVHGALCISYSGQCLFSSLVGGRSANRGKCAQSCRLPYELVENEETIDKRLSIKHKRSMCT